MLQTENTPASRYVTLWIGEGGIQVVAFGRLTPLRRLTCMT